MSSDMLSQSNSLLMWLESSSAWVTFSSCSLNSSWASYTLSRGEWWRSPTDQHSITQNHHNCLSWSPGVVCHDFRPSTLSLCLRLCVDFHWSCVALHLCEEPITVHLQKEVNNRFLSGWFQWGVVVVVSLNKFD